MRFDIVTIFPRFFDGIFEHGILRRAIAEERVAVATHDLREFTHDRHRTVDDRPFGGGEGMVLKPEPIAEALTSLGVGTKLERGAERKTTAGPSTQSSASAEDLAQDDSRNISANTRVIQLSAQGRRFDQALARELAHLDRIVFVCGRYEGVDERVNQLYCDMELSIGDYVLSGGELAAAIVIDTVMRLLPGVLGNEASCEFESFGTADADITTDQEGVPRSQHGAGGLLDYPHYTRPAEFAGLRVPEVLMNGDHQQIRRWRREQQLRKTISNRPDLIAEAQLDKVDRKLIDAIRSEAG